MKKLAEMKKNSRGFFLELSCLGSAPGSAPMGDKAQWVWERGWAGFGTSWWLFGDRAPAELVWLEGPDWIWPEGLAKGSAARPGDRVCVLLSSAQG